LWVEYERFARQGAPTALVVHVARGDAPMRVRIERSLVDALRVDSITPLPLGVETQREWVVYDFAASAPIEVRFDVEPRRAGWASGRVDAAGADVALAQLVYP
jgi:hypothetical protein